MQVDDSLPGDAWWTAYLNGSPKCPLKKRNRMADHVLCICSCYMCLSAHSRHGTSLIAILFIVLCSGHPLLHGEDKKWFRAFWDFIWFLKSVLKKNTLFCRYIHIFIHCSPGYHVFHFILSKYDFTFDVYTAEILENIESMKASLWNRKPFIVFHVLIKSNGKGLYLAPEHYSL